MEGRGDSRTSNYLTRQQSPTDIGYLVVIRKRGPDGFAAFIRSESMAKRQAKRVAGASGARTPAPKGLAKAATTAKPNVSKAEPVKLLAGGNPQIAMGDGDAPVQAYIAAMPGWKSDVGRRLDALIVRTVPGVLKAVKWNSPLYGVDDQRWFLGIHCFTKFIKVAFFRGASLHPVPPGESKSKDTRYLNIHEDDQLDEAQFAAWVQQASQLPAERM